jgi:3-dehydrotetronate 4-kinase
MTDANLVRVLQAQTKHRVGLIAFDSVRGGAAPIRERIAALRREGVSIAIVDATADEDLDAIAAACADLPLVTAGSGIGLGLARHYRNAGLVSHADDAQFLPSAGGAAAVLSGSCSTATNAQVAMWLKARPGFRIDPLRLAAGDDVVGDAIAWARKVLPAGPVLIYATSEPDAVRRVQAELTAERAGALVEDALARALVDTGVRRLIVAGGETSGAVVKALGISSLRIGTQIDPGVPWTEAQVATGSAFASPRLALALKSGNFGSVDFFAKALAMLEPRAESA